MNDETLIFYYYNDGLSRSDRQQVASSLATDPEVADRYLAICQRLEQLRSPEVITPRADMVERWHDSLSRAVQAETSRSRRPEIHTWSFLLGAAIAAALVIGIGIGFFASGNITPPVLAPETRVAGGTHPGAFVRGLQVHLRESRNELSMSPVAVSEDRTLLIVNMIEQNRLYERVAQQNNAPGLARVLRAFELVLTRMAADDITAEEAEALQTKLLFELNVVLTKLARDTSNESQII